MSSRQDPIGCANELRPHRLVRLSLYLCGHRACNLVSVVEETGVVDHEPIKHAKVGRTEERRIRARPGVCTAARFEQTFTAVGVELRAYLHECLATVVRPLSHIIPPRHTFALKVDNEHDERKDRIGVGIRG